MKKIVISLGLLCFSCIKTQATFEPVGAVDKYGAITIYHDQFVKCTMTTVCYDSPLCGIRLSFWTDKSSIILDSMNASLQVVNGGKFVSSTECYTINALIIKENPSFNDIIRDTTVKSLSNLDIEMTTIHELPYRNLYSFDFSSNCAKLSESSSQVIVGITAYLSYNERKITILKNLELNKKKHVYLHGVHNTIWEYHE